MTLHRSNGPVRASAHKPAPHATPARTRTPPAPIRPPLAKRPPAPLESHTPLPPPLGAAARRVGAPAGAPGAGSRAPNGGDVRNNRVDLFDPEMQGERGPKRGSRADLYRLRDWYRDKAVGDRVKSCGRVRYDPDTVRATVRQNAAGKNGAGLTGVRLCESPWACPACGGAVRKRRAMALRHLDTIAQETGRGTHMLTLTIRHHRGASLRVMRKGMAKAWEYVQQSATWRYIVEGHDMDHVRALEVTYGEHGWHPHLHVMNVTDRPLTAIEEREYSAKLTELWIRAVQLKLGDEYAPNPEHALRLSRESPLKYAAKLDLELTDPGDAKSSHGIKPWDLLRCAQSQTSVYTGEFGGYEITPARALRLFQEYESAMKGARLHTASRYLLWLLEDATSDGVFASSFAGAPPVSDKVVGELGIPATLFDALRDIPGAISGLLDDAEQCDPVAYVKHRITTLIESGALDAAWHARIVRWRGGDGEGKSLDFGAPVNPIRDLTQLRWCANGVTRVLYPLESVPVEESQLPLDFPA